MSELKKEIRKKLENIPTYDHALIVSELEKIVYTKFGFSDSKVVCDDSNNGPFTPDDQINVSIMLTKKSSCEHIVCSTTIMRDTNGERIAALKKSRLEKLNKLNDHLNTRIYRQEEPNNPKNGDVYIDSTNDIYIYHGKKKYKMTTIWQDDIKKLREERKNKLNKLNEKKE
jgi:hypothetical protein